MKEKLSATLVAGLIGILLLVLTAPCAFADRRVALVLGNSSYKNILLQAPTPKNDAEDIAKTLKNLGFDVVLATDADLASAGKAIQQFARSAQGADAAFFFFAGHGLQYQGENYLLPTDADIKDEISLPFETVSLASIRAALDRARGVKIMVLDAARRNPIAERLAALTSGRSDSANPQVQAFERTRGVEYANKNDNLIVVFSTTPNMIASETPGRNSPFTTAFLQRLNEPGLEIETLFSRVAADVEAATSGRQKPVIFSSPGQDFYLNQEDRFAWDRVKTTQDPAVLRDFLEHFPSSYFIFEARHRLKALQSALDAAAERAKAEAKEKAEREAREKREADLACQSARKKLGELDPHDHEAFKTLSEAASCGEVRDEAKIKLTASLALIAKEAEACRKDTALLGSLGGADLTKIASLAKNSLCEEVKKAAAEKQTLLEAQKKEEEAKQLREAETCKKEEADLRPLIGAAPSEGAVRDLEDMQMRHQCPGLTKQIDTALVGLKRVVEAACQQDQKALNALAPRDHESLKAFAARKDLCGNVQESALERLAELETRLAREAETCRKEEVAARQLTNKDDKQGLEALRANAECPLVTAYIDQSLQAIAAAKTRTCTKENAELAAIAAEASGSNGSGPATLKSKLDQITTFSARATCDSAKAGAQNKIAELQAKLAKQEAVLAEKETICREEQTKWLGLAATGNRQTINEFRAGSKCTNLAPEIDQKIAALSAVCEKETRNLASLGETDRDGLESLAASSICEEIKTLATAKLTTLEARLAQEAETCRKDQDEWQSVLAQGSKAALETFRARAKCASVIPAIDQKIASLASICEKEAKSLAGLGEADHDGLKSLISSATCEETKNLAMAKLAALEAKLAQEADVCRKDQDQWQSVSVQGSKAALETFRAKAKCASLTPVIDQKIAALKSACEKEAERLTDLDETDHDGLQSFVSAATCEETKNLASAKLGALEARLAQEAETCRKDQDQWQSVSAQGNKAALETFRAKAKCATLIPVIDQKIAALTTACDKESRSLSSLNDADHKGLQALAASAICEETRNLAVAKLATLETRLAQEAETCRKETARWSVLGPNGNLAEAQNFRAQSKCSDLYQDVDQRIATLAKACEAETANLASLSDQDHQGLQSFVVSATCDEAKQNAKMKLAKLEETLAQQDELCRKEEVFRQGFASSTHSADLITLKKHLQCPKVIALLDQRIASLQASCESDQKTLGNLSERDLEGLKNLNATTKCEDVKASASARLSALEAKLDEETAKAKAQEREDKLCQHEGENFAPLAGSNDKVKIEALRKHAHCAEVIAKIDERLAAIDKECKKEETVVAQLEKNDTSGMRNYIAHAMCETSKNAVKLKLEAALTPQDSAPSAAKHSSPGPEVEHHRDRRPKREAEPKEPEKTKTAIKAAPAPRRVEPSQSAAREIPRAASPRAEPSSTPHNVTSFGTGF